MTAIPWPHQIPHLTTLSSSSTCLGKHVKQLLELAPTCQSWMAKGLQFASPCPVWCCWCFPSQMSQLCCHRTNSLCLTHFDQITQSRDLLQRPPAVEPGPPVQEGAFPCSSQTACADPFSTVQTHPSAGPCCLDPPQKACHVFSRSVNFQVLKPLGFQGVYPSSPLCTRATHQEMDNVLLHPAWAGGN